MCMQCPSGKRQSRKWLHCRVCNRSRAECGRISLRGFCMSCAIERSVTNMRELTAKRGPQWERYIDGVRAYYLKLTAP